MNGIERVFLCMKQATGVWVLTLLFLSPAAMAQQQGQWDTPFAESGASPRHLRLMEPPAGSAAAELPHAEAPGRPEHSLGARLLVEGLAGVGTGVALGLAGFGLGLATARGTSYEHGLAALGYGLIGVGVGFPLGVWWGGELMGGDGSLLATLGGYALGGLGLVGVYALGYSMPDPQAAILMGTGVLLPLTGAFLGYERSSSARKRATPRVQPVVALSADRKMLGLAGRF